MKQNRETWIDCVKILACILVAVGQFCQSMVSSGLFSQNGLYCWFTDTIYYFHVQLFFICSGYLYQKTSKVRTAGEWRSNAIRKIVVLGVPYFVFSVITWVLKEMFSGSVNGQNQGLIQTLLLEPSSPYWYLYALFFIFLVTPTFSGRKDAMIGLLAALVLKLCSIVTGETGIYCIATVLANEIWFVIGMALCVYDIPYVCRSSKGRWTGMVTATAFLVFSILISALWKYVAGVAFAMGLLGTVAVILLAVNTVDRSAHPVIISRLAGYTMPVFLMHTIFAAGVRAVLFKIGIASLPIHVIAGLAASFAGPVIAAEVMKKIKLDILLYPGKYIRIGR